VIPLDIDVDLWRAQTAGAPVRTDREHLLSLAKALDVPATVLLNLHDKPLSVRFVREAQRVLRALAEGQP
jgi:hypothetical protein